MVPMAKRLAFLEKAEFKASKISFGVNGSVWAANLVISADARAHPEAGKYHFFVNNVNSVLGRESKKKSLRILAF